MMRTTLYQQIDSISKYIGNYHRYEEKFLEITNHIYIDEHQINVYSLELADLIVNVFSSIEGLSKDIYKYLSDEETGTEVLICFEQRRKDKIRKRLSRNQSDQDNQSTNEITIPEPKFDYDALKALDLIWSLFSKKIKVSSDLIYLDEELSSITPLYNILHKSKDKLDKCDEYNLNKAYQKIKHDRIANIKDATVKNAIESLGALYILCLYGEYAIKPANDLCEPSEPSFVDLYSSFNPSCGSKLFVSEPFKVILSDLKLLEKLSDNQNIDIDQDKLLKGFSVDKIKESIFLIQDQEPLLNEVFYSYYLDKANGLDPCKEISIFKTNSLVMVSSKNSKDSTIDRFLFRYGIHFGGYLESWNNEKEEENFQYIRACGYDRKVVLNTFCHYVLIKDSNKKPKRREVKCAYIYNWKQLKKQLLTQKSEVQMFSKKILI